GTSLLSIKPDSSAAMMITTPTRASVNMKNCGSPAFIVSRTIAGWRQPANAASAGVYAIKLINNIDLKFRSPRSKFWMAIMRIFMIRSIQNDKAVFFERLSGGGASDIFHEITRGVFVLRFLDDRRRVSDLRPLVDRHFVGDLHFLRNRRVGLVDEAGIDVSAFDGGQRRPYVLDRNDLGLHLIPQTSVSQIFGRIAAHRNRRLGERDPLEVLLQ